MMKHNYNNNKNTTMIIQRKINLYSRVHLTIIIIYIHCLMISTICGIDRKVSSTTTIASTIDSCGDYLTDKKGLIYTPNFPNPFIVPIKCRWVIDASNALLSSNNHSIIVYLTQVYVYKGLRFTEYAYYESESTNFGGTLVQKITEGNIFKHRQLKTNRPFLVIEFELERLEGNHVRVLDHLLNVHGFNITYEITDDSTQYEFKSCSVQDCSFTGNCIVSSDYRKQTCQCFDQFYGEKCSNGPLCFDDNNNSICKNEGTCSHVGSATTRCQCKADYVGQYCEIPIKDHKLSRVVNCEDGDEDFCILQCPAPTSSTKYYNPCDCREPTPIYSNRARYECRIKLSNVTLARSSTSAPLSQASSTLEALLKKQLVKYLRNADILNMEDFKIINVTSSAEVTFHFYGISSEGDKIRDALNRLVQRRRLNDFILESTYFTFQQNPSLRLQSFGVKNYLNEREVRLNDELTLVCVAQGSSGINFFWYKDNLLVNTSKSIRKMSIKNTVSNDGSTYVSQFTIDKATTIDKGQYTCQVVDWGMQQCKSIYINVRDEPNVKIIPMSATVERGSNIQLTCITPNMNSLGIGFGWTKNRALLKLEPTSQVWEDLYPAGSILKIINTQKSAIFTCNVAHRSMSVRVDVVNRTLIPICINEKAWNMHWSDTGPGSEAFLECPRQFIGNKVSRLCMMENSTTAMWQIPDFSECLYRPFITPYTSFQSLTLGYQNISGVNPSAVKMFWDIMRQRKLPLYPGEGDRILRILSEIEQYYRNAIVEHTELFNSAELFMMIINRILDDDYSIIRHYNQLLLQQIIYRNLQYWMHNLLIKQDLYNQDYRQNHLVLSSMVIDIQPFHLLGYHLDDGDSDNQQLYIFNTPIEDYTYPNWYDDNKVSIKLIINQDIHTKINQTWLMGTVILFKNITRFLPNTYIKELSDGTDFEYHLYSKIMTVAIFPLQFLDLTSKIQIELVIHHSHQNRSFANISCGMEYKFSGTWDLDACITTLLPDQMSTRCTCPSPGIFALFSTTRAIRVSYAMKNRTSTFIVLLGCACGLLQSAISLFILSYSFWRHKTWLNFLKLQFSVAFIGVMIIFIYATYYTTLPETSFAIIAVSIETLFLIGMSAPISQALIVYADLAQIRPSSQHFQPTIIAIITGLPVLCVLTTELSHKSTGNRHDTWWLTFGSNVYNIFISCVMTMVLLFIVVYTEILRKTRSAFTDAHNTTGKREIVEQRVSVIHRATVILCVLVLVVIASICYINSTNEIYHYVFSSLSAFLGFIILSIYVGNREIILVMTTIFCKFKWKNMMKKDTSSDPIKICAKISAEFENDNSVTSIPLANVAVLRHTSTIRRNDTDATAMHSSATLQMPCTGGGSNAGASTINMRKYINKTPEKNILKSATPQGAACYLPEINNSGSKINNQNYSLDDINLETYSTSPRKYQEFNAANTFSKNNAELPMYSTSEYYANSRTKVFRPAGTDDSSLDCLNLQTDIYIPSPKILCCSADIESRININNTIAMPDVTLATAATDTSVHTILNTVEVKNRERANIIPDIASSVITECKKSDCHQTTSGSCSSHQRDDITTADCEQNTSGMLDRISHDLDYLLNRTQSKCDE